MKVLGIIPARGGSKGIPGKNALILDGRPVIQYTIEAARKARCLARLILTTDSPEIAKLGGGFGVEVPFLRPPELAEDDTPMVPVLRHAVSFLEAAGDSYDAVCLLQPTCPLRSAECIDACCRLMMSSGADTVLTVLPVPHRYNPLWVYLKSEDDGLRPALPSKEEIGSRQQLPRCYAREGSVYLVRRRVLMDGRTLFGDRIRGYPVDPAESVNLDEPADLDRARQLLRESSASREKQ